MKLSPVLSSCIALAGMLPGALSVSEPSNAGELVPRADPDAPDGYTPVAEDCPSGRPTIRTADGLSDNEKSWLSKRKKETTSSLKEFFKHVTISGFDAVNYIDKNADTANQPIIGIALSGGGYRALLNGAGALKAFDDRTPNTTTGKGQLGGLLQSSTYVAGLSGGSWLVGSVYMNNFSRIDDLQTHKSGDVWQFSKSIFEGPAGHGLQVFDSAEYYTDIYSAVKSKKHAGWDTTITDYWGRALAYQLIRAKDGGPSYTWSSIANDSDFSSGKIPMPLVVADSRYPDNLYISPENSTVYEISPWELGTFDPTIYGFAPLEYLGSNFSGGSLPDNEKCVRGFDSGSYIMGTSSTLFNQFFLNLGSTSIPGFFKDAIGDTLKEVGKKNEDIALYGPNPFKGFAKSTNPFADQDKLVLVDGGEDKENLPLAPLIQPERKVDVIFAIDSSADTENSWPNGTSLVASYERSLNSSGIANHTAFPYVPDTNTFVNHKMNSEPTFFGCNASNTSHPTPLIVYIPNHPYTYHSNVSTFQDSYKDSERDNIILNGFNAATMGNGTSDKNWPTCVGCAILSRSFDRTKTQYPSICNKCFDTYCWDGTTEDSTPSGYNPPYVIHNSPASAAGPSVLGPVLAVAAVIFILT